MANAFDEFLESALAPSDRLPDRRFVAGVQARIALEDQLAAEDRAVIARLVSQLAGLFAVAAGLWVVGRAAPVADWFAQSPFAGALTLLAAFSFVVMLFTTGERSDGSAFGSA